MELPEKQTQTTLEKPIRFSQQVAEHLRREIIEGYFQAGETLPSEAVLGKRFGVSRAVIREALASLKYAGLLIAEQGRGVIVMRPEQRMAFRIDTVLDNTDDDYAHIYDMRAVLEIEAAAWAAVRRTAEDLRDLKFYRDQLAEAIKKKKDGTEAHRGFNLTLFKAAKNPYLYDFMIFLVGHLDRRMRKDRERIDSSPGVAAVVLKEHIAILDAIVAGDPTAARRATVEHLHQAARRKGLTASVYHDDCFLLSARKKGAVPSAG
jgi:GntR family transcriptional repressor for pyruvate dehydrogenase complex